MTRGWPHALLIPQKAACGWGAKVLRETSQQLFLRVFHFIQGLSYDGADSHYYD